jgi:carbonic anhydrase/acetyltransferase-like protein (isoleucine patch superfamily)
MDVRAILLTGVPPEPGTASADAVAGTPEHFSGTPFVLLPVLGQPLVQRIADRLMQCGVDSVTVLNTADPCLPLIQEARRSDVKWKDVSAEQVWRAAEDEFQELVQAGAELVIVIRAGAYSEVEIDPLLQFHLDRRNHTTQVIAPDGPLDFFVLSGSRRNDAAFLLRSKLTRMRLQTQPFLSDAYVNRLRSSAEMRKLVVDSLMLKTRIQPMGEQVRPGIWIGSGARVDRSVRLVAPCYIGPHARVRAGSLITRASSLEHHTVVDCGTVVEASTVLPLSYIGAGLDLTHSVVGFKRILSIKYSAELEVEDKTLVSELPTTSALRTLSHAANLISFLPRQMLQSVFSGRKLRESQVVPECPPVEFDPGTVARPAAKERQGLTPSVVAGMRDYGNQ